MAEEEELKTEVRGGVGCILLNRHSLNWLFLETLIKKRHFLQFIKQTKEAELPEPWDDPKDDEDGERVEPEEQWGASGCCAGCRWSLLVMLMSM